MIPTVRPRRFPVTRRPTLTALGAVVVCSLLFVGAAAGDEPDEQHAVSKAKQAVVVAALERRAGALEGQVEGMEESARRYRGWIRCISLVEVRQYGDVDHGSGFEYDDRDGTGPDYRPALAPFAGSYTATDYAFLNFADRPACRTAATVPGGTAEAAELTPSTDAATKSARSTPAQRVHRRPTLKDRMRWLQVRTNKLEKRAERVTAMTERFDEWESCLSWVPVTEYGDPDGRFGYRVDGADASAAGYRTAIAVDSSQWDDPDYEVLAFVGRDRPFTQRECGNEPGESVD
jgi:hypothetical protein